MSQICPECGNDIYATSAEHRCPDFAMSYMRPKSSRPVVVIDSAELATLRHKLAEAEKELARSRENRLLICSHCGHGIEWDSSEPKNTVSAMQAHELTCAENPLRAALAAAEADCAAMREALESHAIPVINMWRTGKAWSCNPWPKTEDAVAALNKALTRPTGQSILDELSAARKVCEIAQWQENGGMWPENYAGVLAEYRVARKTNTGVNNGKL